MLTLALLLLSGCVDGSGDAVTIATAWPAEKREEFAERFPRGTKFRWVLLAPTDDLRRVVLRRNPPDMILGGAASVYEELAAEGRLDPAGDDGIAWRATPQSWVPNCVLLSRLETPAPPRPAGDGLPGPVAFRPRQEAPVAFDDPRTDPVSSTWAEYRLRTGPTSRADWFVRYARLVEDAAGRRPPGRETGAARAALERGEVDQALTVGPHFLGGFTIAGMTPGESAKLDRYVRAHDVVTAFTEGVAVVRGARHAVEARKLLGKLILDLDKPPAPSTTPQARSLLDDLLGSTLVDAHDELIAAWQTLDETGRPDKSFDWLTQPPPWPPASVGKILARESNAMPMLETLVGQLAPEPDARDWLLRSWLAKPHVVDWVLLGELAGAADGRLVREPRFRAWLRSEWTAWARQRYRRVARQAKGWKPAGAPS